MLRATKSASVTRVTVLVALLVATVLVASLLGYEAHDASRSERVTVERALQDYATVAAWELQSAAHKRVESALQQALSPVVTGTASSPYETLLPLSIVSSAAQTLLPCAAGVPDTGRTYVRLDLRDGSFTSSGPGLSAEGESRLIEGIRQYVQSRAAPEQPFGLMRLPAGGERVLALGVKYAMHGAPLAAYGFSVCGEALGPSMAKVVVATHPLLPSAVRGEISNDSLIVVRVTDRTGRELYSSGSAATSYAASVVLDSTLGLSATVAVREAAATRLLVERPSRSRVPVLIALLIMTAGLAVVALLQLRREHELARLRADFTSSVSHELRTPLAQILLFGETLSLGRARDEREQELAARTIVTEARRLIRMVENILLFERGRHSAIGPGDGQTELVDLAGDVVRAFAPLAASSGARVVLEVGALLRSDRAGAWLRGDPSLVRQILLNLLDNAVKYGPRGQVVRVTIDVTVSGDGLMLTVSDEGPGVPQGQRDRIWEPYVRLRAGDARGGAGRPADGGAGLGLAVVKDLVLALGGQIWVEDGREGLGGEERIAGEESPVAARERGGARFVLTVPRLRETAGARGAPPENQNTTPPQVSPHPNPATPTISVQRRAPTHR